MSHLLRLLLIEDSEDDELLLLRVLRRAGYEVQSERVETATAMSTALAQSTWDIVISDYSLPTFNAPAALELLQSSGLDLPFVIVSGTIGEEVAVAAMKAGAHDFLAKENLARLVPVIERELREAAMRRERRHAEAQLAQQAERDRLLGAIALRIRRSLDLNEILNTTVAEVRQFLQADRVLVFRFEAMQKGILVAASFDPNWIIEDSIEIEQSWFSRSRLIWDQGEIQPCDDVARSKAQFAPAYFDLISRFHVKAKLVIPILQDDQLWGLLAVHQCTEPRHWKPAEIDLLGQLATQVAIAIAQARLFTQVQQQAQREQLLNQMSRALNSSLDPDYILQEIVKLTGECFKVDRVFIFALKDEQIRVVTEWRSNGQVGSMLDFEAPAADWLSLEDCDAATHRHRTFHDTDLTTFLQDPNRSLKSHPASLRSGLSVPIFIRDRLFGGINLNTTTVYRTFTTDEIEFLQQIAEQAAIALYNAQSYEHLEELVQERTQELEKEKLVSETANRSKTEFLSNMSHELRTPLTSILGFSKVLLQGAYGALNNKQHQYLERILTSGEHLLALLNDLLDLSKVEAGKEELLLTTVDIKDICQACTSLINERAQNQGLQLFLDISPDVTTCVADDRRLKQILFNLLSNAVKFTSAGSVTLKVTKSADIIHFAVIDTGIGISEADQATLFQPFRQLDGGLARKYEGTGLGLALSRKLARLHNGDITVSSVLGEGSCFTLHLPEHFTNPDKSPLETLEA
jgi:signal transduction histidine kinase/FixJ family two-component response regulator